MINAKFIVSLLLVIGCTVFVLDLIYPEHGNLFIADSIVIGAVELVLLLNLFFFTSDKVKDLANVAFIHYVNIAAVCLFIWMLIYNVGMKDDTSLTTFYVISLLIVLVCSILSLLTSTTAAVAHEKQQFVNIKVEKKKNYKEEINEYGFQAKKAFRKMNFEGCDELKRTFQIVLDKASTIPADALVKKEKEAESVLILLSEVVSICNSSEWNNNIKEEMIDKLESLNQYVKILKS